jgi:hypothetical protein
MSERNCREDAGESLEDGGVEKVNKLRACVRERGLCHSCGLRQCVPPAKFADYWMVGCKALQSLQEGSRRCDSQLLADTVLFDFVLKGTQTDA